MTHHSPNSGEHPTIDVQTFCREAWHLDRYCDKDVFRSEIMATNMQVVDRIARKWATALIIPPLVPRHRSASPIQIILPDNGKTKKKVSIDFDPPSYIPHNGTVQDPVTG